MKSFSWLEIKHCILDSDQKILWRPLAVLSFALNYKFGGMDVFGFHVVNFIIHYLAAVFLFLFIHNTLKLPLLREKYSLIAYPIALLATFFWALNPVHVTCVTYIVQRYASMVGLFYIMTMYFYLKARTSENQLIPFRFYPVLYCRFCRCADQRKRSNAADQHFIIRLIFNSRRH